MLSVQKVCECYRLHQAIFDLRKQYMENEPVNIIVAKAIVVIGAGAIFGLSFLNLIFASLSTDVIYSLVKPWLIREK